MGSVYLAHDTQLDRPVALKVPHFEARDGAQVLARFYREARAAATVLHPNICPLHDVGEIDGMPYLTMAYVEGKALSDFTRARPLMPRQSALLVRKLALALPGAEESTSYGTPAVKVNGKLFVRLREEGGVIVIRIDRTGRAMRLATDPKAFFFTDHYAAFPYMLVRLGEVAVDDLKELLTDSWRLVAPGRAVGRAGRALPVQRG